MDQTSTYSPLVMQETSDGLRLYDIRDEMLASREIEITGAIDAGSVSTAIRCLLHLQKEDQQLPITLYINSPGGEVQSGLALYAGRQLPDSHGMPRNGSKHGSIAIHRGRPTRNAAPQPRDDPRSAYWRRNRWQRTVRKSSRR